MHKLSWGSEGGGREWSSLPGEGRACRPFLSANLFPGKKLGQLLPLNPQPPCPVYQFLLVSQSGCNNAFTGHSKQHIVPKVKVHNQDRARFFLRALTKNAFLPLPGPSSWPAGTAIPCVVPEINANLCLLQVAACPVCVSVPKSLSL